MNMEKPSTPPLWKTGCIKMGGFRRVYARARAGQKPFNDDAPAQHHVGQLHMGHAMDEVPTDILIRHHRMKGDPTLCCRARITLPSPRKSKSSTR